jgi:head-to-tail connecting protein
MADINALAKRLERLKTLRVPHEQVWRECFDHSFPIRGSGLQGNALSAQEALNRKARLLDGTATDAGRTLAAAIMSGLTPANSRWFQLEVPGADDEGERWLDQKGSQLHQEIHASTFDAAAYECCLDIVGAGWFALYIDADDAGGFRFEQWAMAGVYATTTKAGGLVDTVFREYTLTALQAVTAFPGQCSERVTKQALEEPDAPVTLCHAIYPRATFAVGAKMAKNMPIASCHFEVEAKKELRESGYQEMPVIVPRWMVIPDSVYAVGPMFDALPDARTLNEMKRMDLANADLAISGMWIAEDDGVLNPRTIKVGARKVIVANSVDSMKPLSQGGNWQLADERIAQLQASIRKILMADQLQPQDGPAMTATEVHVRVGMIRQLLGPIYGRLQAEYLQPLITRCFGLMYRAGVLGQAPQSLQNRSFTIKYISPLARAQKMEDVGAIERLHGNLLQLVELGAQGVAAASAAADVVNFDENMRTLIEGLGVPLKNSRTFEEVQQMRDQRSQQQAQAQQQAQQQQMQTMAADTAMKRSLKAA